MDISNTIIAKSDQLNADDLIAGPITVRITNVKRGSTEEQPIQVEIDGGHRPWRPCKTARRILAAGWGTDASKWIGQRVTLYRDPKVKWGGQEVGGIRVAAMSGIKARMTMALAVAKGKKEANVIEVLPDAAPSTPAASLAEVLTGAGLTMADFDRWRAANDKPTSETLSPTQQGQIAGWFAADPTRFEALRPATEEGDPEVPF